MKRISMGMINWLLTLLVVVTLPGCTKSVEEKGGAGFNGRSEKLLAVPAGGEAGESVFRADGRGLAAAVKVDGKTVVYHAGKMYGPYESVRDLQLAAGGGTVAYIARKGDKEAVVVNGSEGELFTGINGLRLGVNGTVVYAAQRDVQMYVVVGNRLSEPFDRSASSPVSSYNGTRVAYVERHESSQKSNLRVCTADMDGCRNGNVYDDVSGFRSDASRSRLVYTATRAGKKTLVSFDFRKPALTEKESAWYDDVASFNISPNGEHFAFLARRGLSSFLVRDGQEQPVAGFDTSFDFTVADSGNVIYVALTRDKVSCFIDGRQLGQSYDAVESPLLSADGAHSLFAAKEGEKYFIVTDGVRGPGFDMAVTPRFSPDGSKVVYRARDKGARFVVVADRQGRILREHPQYEAVWETVFAPDGKSVGYGVKSGQEFWWKVEML